MKTLSEVIAWLKQPDHIRVILLEIPGVLVGGVATPHYLSNKAFTSYSTDTPSNTYYTPCVTGSLSFSESIDLDGNPSIGYGDIEIDNTAGIRDGWLNNVWANKSINIYIGDPRWQKNDYYLVFTGVIASLVTSDRNKLNLVLLNKLERLNKPITESLLGGIGNNKDRIKPLLFGECFNVEPIFTDPVPVTLTYMVHDGPIERIIEVRDNGLPVLFTSDLANGKFTLSRNPAGQITASVQGYNPSTYSNNIGTLIQSIATSYGPTNSRLSIGDIDTTNFNSFISNNTQPVGIYCKDRENILDICQKLANSVGASVVMSSQGKLRLIKLSLPASGTAYSIYPEDTLFNELHISEIPDIKGTIKLNYCKNWTVENSNLAGGVPTNHVGVFEKEWYSVEQNNSTVTNNYSLDTEPEPYDTCLLVESDANAEASRRLTLWSTQRFIVSLTCYAHMLPIELGDSITIYNSRYGMGAGRSGIAISIERDWVSGRVTLGVLI